MTQSEAVSEGWSALHKLINTVILAIEHLLIRRWHDCLVNMDNILFPVGRLDRVIVPEDPRIDAWKNSFYRLDAILRPHYDIAQLYIRCRIWRPNWTNSHFIWRISVGSNSSISNPDTSSSDSSSNSSSCSNPVVSVDVLFLFVVLLLFLDVSLLMS